MDLNSQSRPYLCLAIRATFTFSYPWKVLSAASRFPCFTVGLASPLKLLITMVPATFCCLVYLIILINNQITMHETSLYSGAKKISYERHSLCLHILNPLDILSMYFFFLMLSFLKIWPVGASSRWYPCFLKHLCSF